MFEAEAAGLAEIAATNTIRVPEVYDVGTRADCAYIEMERLQLRATTAADETAAGEQLAAIQGSLGVSVVMFNENGTLLITGGLDGTTRLWGIPAE